MLFKKMAHRATPFPRLNLGLVRTETFLPEKSFGWRNIKIQPGRRGDGANVEISLSPWNAQRTTTKKEREDDLPSLFFVVVRCAFQGLSEIST